MGNEVKGQVMNKQQVFGGNIKLPNEERFDVFGFLTGSEFIFDVYHRHSDGIISFWITDLYLAPTSDGDYVKNFTQLRDDILDKIAEQRNLKLCFGDYERIIPIDIFMGCMAYQLFHIAVGLELKNSSKDITE